jgi:hypothetical protein
MLGRFVLQSFTSDLQRFTREHSQMMCYTLGLGLDNFKIVALKENFRKLNTEELLQAYGRCAVPLSVCLFQCGAQTEGRSCRRPLTRPHARSFRSSGHLHLHPCAVRLCQQAHGTPSSSVVCGVGGALGM